MIYGDDDNDVACPITELKPNTINPQSRSNHQLPNLAVFKSVSLHLLRPLLGLIATMTESRASSCRVGKDVTSDCSSFFNLLA
jgi:hypothetical protein